MKFKGYANTVVGSREMNQDSYLVDDEKSVYAVADGIGGGFKGEVASKMAMDGLKARFQSGTLISEIVQYLQKSIYMEAINNFGEPLMGTTFTAVHLLLDEATVCHVGDSRLYLFDGSLLKQITTDHEQFDDKLNGTVLTSYLGLDTKQFEMKVQEERIKVAPGQELLLCSDGLYKQVEEVRIVEILKAHQNEPQVALEKLCTEAAQAMHSDNVTVVLVKITE